MKLAIVVLLSVTWIAVWSIPRVPKKIRIVGRTENNIFGKSGTTNARQFGGRIIGGEPARAGQFPYAAAVSVKTESSTFFCSGALLTRKWILVTGGCVEQAVSFIITLGSHNLNGEDLNRLVVSTTAYIQHPDYNASTLDNDIALIQLREEITFTDYISSIYLPTTDVTTNTEVTAIGWGQTSDHITAPVTQLQTVSVITISNDECKSFYGEQITDNMVCIGGNSNEGACTGDAGGPLVYYLNHRHPVHVGVASFISANGCEAVDPSGYIRTHRYRDWILDVIQNVDLYES